MGGCVLVGYRFMDLVGFRVLGFLGVEVFKAVYEDYVIYSFVV